MKKFCSKPFFNYFFSLKKSQPKLLLDLIPSKLHLNPIWTNGTDLACFKKTVFSEPFYKFF